MSADLWTDRARTALGGPLGYVSSAVVIHPDALEPITLDLTGGSITWDEGWSPHVQATLTARVPEDQATLDMMDPRQGARVQITAGYRYPGGAEDVAVTADLMLTRRRVRRPSNVLELLATSDETALQDWTPLGTSRIYTTAHTASYAIADLITWALPGSYVNVDFPPTAWLTAPLAVSTGDDLDRIVGSIADQVDAWVYHDGLTGWQVTRRAATAGAAVAQLRVGPTGTLTDTDTGLDRDEFANAVLYQFRPPGSATITQAWAEVTSGPFAVATVGRKVRTVAVPSAGSTGQARAAATALVRRTVSRGRSMTLTAAQAPLWVRPGDTVTVELPTGPQERHLVARATVDLMSGAGTYTTRVPDDVTITTGE